MLCAYMSVPVSVPVSVSRVIAKLTETSTLTHAGPFYSGGYRMTTVKEIFQGFRKEFLLWQKQTVQAFRSKQCRKSGR